MLLNQTRYRLSISLVVIRVWLKRASEGRVLGRAVTPRVGADLILSAAVDLCAEGTHGCEHLCVNSVDSYVCRCRAGFALQQDQRSCRGKYASRHPLSVSLES